METLTKRQSDPFVDWLKSLASTENLDYAKGASAGAFEIEHHQRFRQLKSYMHRIFQKKIMNNCAIALERYPNDYSKAMPFIDLEVNGFPLKAVVDSGVQSTTISKGCLELCRLGLEERYEGIAYEAGHSKICGRTHGCLIKIEKMLFLCELLVLDSPNIEMIFGLDMLRKNKCRIDLKDNVLRVPLSIKELCAPFVQERQAKQGSIPTPADLPYKFVPKRKYFRYMNPFYPGPQNEIEDLIIKKGFDENCAAALECSSSLFKMVAKPFLQMEVDGLPFKALVHSGAKSTTMSEDFAQGLMLDECYKGIAERGEIGVPTHQKRVKIGDEYYEVSFSVTPSLDVDFVFGLDMLQKHKCIIDLRKNKLWFGDGVVVSLLEGMEGCSLSGNTRMAIFDYQLSKDVGKL